MSYLRIWIESCLLPWDDASNRLFSLNILLTLLYTACWVLFFYKHTSWNSFRKDMWRLVFRKKYWWNRSTKLDYTMFFCTSTVFMIPIWSCVFPISRYTLAGLRSYTNLETLAVSSSNMNLLLFTLGAFLLNDFIIYAYHVLLHKVPWLWEIHITHHSARIMTPFTFYRAHTLEVLIGSSCKMVATGMGMGLFVFLFDSPYHIVNLLGANIFTVIANTFASNLRHSHIPISFGFLEYVFVSPKQHQIHHSKLAQHYDKNYGSHLSIWDTIMGTLTLSREVTEPLSFGVRGEYRQTFSHIVLRWKKTVSKQIRQPDSGNENREKAALRAG